MTDNTPTREVAGQYDGPVVRAKSVLSPEGFPVRALVKLYPKQIIPIIFIPGIMGTNLRVKNGKGYAWRPPNGKLAGLIQVIQYLGKDAAARKKVLHPDRVEVDGEGAVSLTRKVEKQLKGAPDLDPEELARLYGWGELHRDSYGRILNTLQERLHDTLKTDGTPDDAWVQLVLDQQKLHQFGAEKPFEEITPDDLKRFANAAYPVHAVGYNWLQSNNVSVQRLVEKIDAITDFYKNTLNKDCEKVILVTHSMGGLVARACTQLQGKSDKVLGVLHGVMPAIGAPATYKRMRAGFEGVEQVLLGRNAAEATAVLTQAPGPMELLPTAEYQAKLPGGVQHWLRAHYGKSKTGGDEITSFLGEGDPYDTVYLNKADWWRLVKSELINPEKEKRSSKDNQSTSRTKDADSIDIDFTNYSKALFAAQEFHSEVKGQYHGNCHAYYAADSAQSAWGEVRWSANTAVPNFVQGVLVDDDLNGAVKVKFGEQVCELEIAGRDLPGDGTVPELSGQAPKPFVKQIFRHEGKLKGHFSYDHQGSYSNDFTAGLTLYSIVKLTLSSGVLKEG
ncbi:esterase/lipase family protein [Pseudoduganella sp. R-32]|uniref:esterase/lipase family protein n=1 Tax=Pseudoduganella sp. R-32 TaxID=3404061 RepID=UPI003CF02914